MNRPQPTDGRAFGLVDFVDARSDDLFEKVRRFSGFISDVRLRGRLQDILRTMFRAGLWADGLPYPAVARGSERVRFRVSALHTRAELNSALEAVAHAFKSVECLACNQAS